MTVPLLGVAQPPDWANLGPLTETSGTAAHPAERCCTGCRCEVRRWGRWRAAPGLLYNTACSLDAGPSWKRAPTTPVWCCCSPPLCGALEAQALWHNREHQPRAASAPARFTSMSCFDAATRVDLLTLPVSALGGAVWRFAGPVGRVGLHVEGVTGGGLQVPDDVLQSRLADGLLVFLIYGIWGRDRKITDNTFRIKRQRGKEGQIKKGCSKSSPCPFYSNWPFCRFQVRGATGNNGSSVALGARMTITWRIVGRGVSRWM